MVLNMGPQHPSTHGVLRLKLWLDGEVVIKAVPYLGYLHRGVEKLLEKLSYVQSTPIVDKNDYVASMTNELALVMAFEKLEGCEVPRRARYLRTICAEMQRVASHLLWLGTFALDMGGALGGGTTAFMYCLRERERILDLFEELTGARFHYHMMQIGGVRHDLPVGWDVHMKQVAADIRARIPEYESMLSANPIFRSRTKGIGRIDARLAMELGLSGPNLRACGVDFDLRRSQPYAAYDEIEVHSALAYEGDVYARYQVRVAEMYESLRIATALVDGVPAGPIMGRKPIETVNAVKPPAGEAYVAIDSPRGELGCWVVSDGSPRPYRCKLRPPSYHALAALPYLLPGTTIPDVVVILGSLDPIMGEADR
ncbi:MAG: NADH-quinone oxidoreductase subunit D [Planctomycetes bacterium]|nr:NADH-quinone oxidoreductase subunit D [Planctomycetota bacterium]